MRTFLVAGVPVVLPAQTPVVPVSDGGVNR